MADLIQPFGDKVLIKVLLPEQETAGGLLVAPVSKEKSNRGLVIATGEGITLSDGTIRPLSVKAGDEVLFTYNSGVNFSTGKDDYKVIAAKDILGKFIKDGDRDE